MLFGFDGYFSNGIKQSWLESFSIERFLSFYPHSMESVNGLEKTLDYAYKNKGVALVALIHRSALVKWPDNRDGIFSNEKFEFLGDSLINFFVTASLSRKFPNFNEGALSRARSNLVSTQNLARKSEVLNLSQHLIFGPGSSREQCAENIHVKADAFEAIAASLLLDAGFDFVLEWLSRQYEADLGTSEPLIAVTDVKSRLQVWVQSVVPIVPEYRFAQCKEDPHEFECQVFLGNQRIAFGTGRNKKMAAKSAAEQACTLIQEGSLTVNFLRGLSGKG